MSFPPPNQPPYGAPVPGMPGMPQVPGHHHQGSYAQGPHHQQHHHSGRSTLDALPLFDPTLRPRAIAPGASALINTTGAFEGVQFKIDHRDTNSLLNLQLQPGYEIKARPGAMVAMGGTVQIKGKMKFRCVMLICSISLRYSLIRDQFQKDVDRWRGTSPKSSRETFV